MRTGTVRKKKWRNRTKSVLLTIVLIFIIGSSWEQNVYATEQDEQEIDVSLLEEFDFSQIDEMLQEETSEIRFRDVIERLIAGEEIDKGWLIKELMSVALKDVSQSRGYLIQIILLAAVFALLYQFSNVFQNAPAAEISFYVVYMILLGLLMKNFLLLSNILNETMQLIIDFMQALLPAFCLSMMFSTGTATTMAIYQLTMFLIYILEKILMHVVIPGIHVYIVLELLNHLTREEFISKMTELVKGAIEWVLKTLFTVVIGINIVQGLLTPVIDSFKTSAFARTAGMLPGVGGSVQAVAEVMIGTGIIIKNAVGVAGIVVLLFLCAGPMLKIGIITLLYKVTAAAVQPIAEKRFAGCVSGMGEGARLYGKVLMTANVMFLITIALVTAVTTWNR